jgi:hypothetical protein
MAPSESSSASRKVISSDIAPAIQDQIIHILQALGESPPRCSDALADLMMLPTDIQRDETILRLKYLAFAGLGFHEELETTLAEMKKL